MFIVEIKSSPAMLQMAVPAQCKLRMRMRMRLRIRLRIRLRLRLRARSSEICRTRGWSGMR